MTGKLQLMQEIANARKNNHQKTIGIGCPNNKLKEHFLQRKTIEKSAWTVSMKNVE